jgi:hypothetical protein
MNDLLGPVLVTIRDFPAVAAITTRVRGGELAAGDTAPAVVIVALSNTRSPFGPGKGRIGLQGPRYAVNCFGVTYQQSAQLAGAVSDALHNLSPRTVSGKTLHQVIDDGWGGPVRDPATGWATETVVFQVTGSA